MIKRADSHSIDDEGSRLFERSLIDSDELGMVPRDVAKDYGIDGEIQIFKSRCPTGEFFKFQLKSTGRAKYSRDGDLLCHVLDLDHAFFLAHLVQDPVVLVVADISNNKVYWHPMQTDSILAESILKKKSNAASRNIKNPSVTVRISTKRILNTNTCNKLHGYLKEIKNQLAQRTILQSNTSNSIGENFRNTQKIMKDALTLEGFDYQVRSGDDAPSGTMFSMKSKGYTIDYIPNELYKDSNAPQLRLTTRFSLRKTNDRKDYDNFHKTLKGINEGFKLDHKYIKFFEVKSGNTLIDNSANFPSMTLILKNIPKKIKQHLIIGDGDKALNIIAEIWRTNNKLHIEAIQPEGIEFKIISEVDDSDTLSFQAKLSIRVSDEYITSLTQTVNLLEFFESIKSPFNIYLVNQVGLRERIIYTSANKAFKTDQLKLEFMRALLEIEKITKISIDYPLPKIISKEEVANVFRIRSFLQEEVYVGNVTINANLINESSESTQINSIKQLNILSPEISLFNKSYILGQFKQVVKGTIERTTALGLGQYEVIMKNATIVIIPKQKP